MKIAVYRKFYDAVEANIVLKKLRANGIEGFLTNEFATNLLWHLNFAHGGVDLMLNTSDFQRADMILDDAPMPVEELVSEGPRCPKCHSNNVKFGSQSRKRINWFQFVSLVLIAGPAPTMSKAFHCFNCGNNFERKEINSLNDDAER